MHTERLTHWIDGSYVGEGQDRRLKRNHRGANLDRVKRRIVLIAEQRQGLRRRREDHLQHLAERPRRQDGDAKRADAHVVLGAEQRERDAEAVRHAAHVTHRRDR